MPHEYNITVFENSSSLNTLRKINACFCNFFLKYYLQYFNYRNKLVAQISTSSHIKNGFFNSENYGLEIRNI